MESGTCPVISASVDLETLTRRRKNPETSLMKGPERQESDEVFKRLGLQNCSVPKIWGGSSFCLLPASPEWSQLDLDAVQSSRSELLHLFGPEDAWPPSDLTLEQNAADLSWHAKEFLCKRSIAYHILSLGRDKCFGCLYLYPTASRAHDVEAYLWVRSELHSIQRLRIENEVINWVITEWPFEVVAWPGRFVSFKRWQALAVPNYYAQMRCREVLD